MAIPSLLELVADGNSVAIRFSKALSTIRLSLASAIARGATVSLPYTSVNGADRPGFGDIRSASTNERAAFFRASSSTAAVKTGETALITFTFSRDTGATFTPTPSSSGTASTTVASQSASNTNSSSRLSSIEACDLTGTGENALSLGLADLHEQAPFNWLNSATASGLGRTSGTFNVWNSSAGLGQMLVNTSITTSGL